MSIRIDVVVLLFFCCVYHVICRRYESLVVVCHVFPRGCLESRLLGLMLVDSFSELIVSVRMRDEPDLVFAVLEIECTHFII
jgi:hypothetical protein